LSSTMWRFDKNWKGLRREVPWVDRLPSEILHEHLRLSLQHVDGPDDPAQLLQSIGHLGSEDMLLFSTDYPHWQAQRPEDIAPAGLPEPLRAKILATNATATYGRLR
ncbi:MAG: amidohydrolase family protein, partial [Mycobacterium sp.]|nr:amidohydrolase family protein [Mycobacterium sp.]